MCQFCNHRVDVGLEPACVNTCPTRAMVFGDLRDPNSEASRLLATNPVQVLKPEKDTRPQVYYISADMQVMRAFGYPSPEGKKTRDLPDGLPKVG